MHLDGEFIILISRLGYQTPPIHQLNVTNKN